jgi:excisionase family DNA binding protein
MPELKTRRALTVAEAAYSANTSKKLIYAEIERGNLQATRLGRLIRITPESFDAWMAGSKPEPAVDPRIAEIVAAATPLTDEQVDDIVAIIVADRGGAA